MFQETKSSSGFCERYLIEASDQAFSLLHHSSLYPPLHHPLYVFLLVLLRDRDVGSAGLQLSFCYLWKHTRKSYFERLIPQEETKPKTFSFTISVLHLFLSISGLTCPKTSSLTVKVRSSMSSMSLSFIHWRDW